MFINPELEELILIKAVEFDAKGLTDGVIEDKLIGGLNIFIDKKPLISLVSFKIKDDA